MLGAGVVLGAGRQGWSGQGASTVYRVSPATRHPPDRFAVPVPVLYVEAAAVAEGRRGRRRFSAADWATGPAEGAIRALPAAAVCRTRYAGCADGVFVVCSDCSSCWMVDTQSTKREEKGQRAAGRAWPSGRDACPRLPGHGGRPVIKQEKCVEERGKKGRKRLEEVKMRRREEGRTGQP